MKPPFWIFLTTFLFSNISIPLYSTPDNDLILFAGYPNSEKATELRNFIGSVQNISVRIDLNRIRGLSKKKKTEIRTSILEALEKDSYFRWTENFESAKSKEKNLIRIAFDRYEIGKDPNDFTEVEFTAEVIDLKRKTNLTYKHSGKFSPENPKELKNFIIEWKKDFFPSEESFMIEEFFCYDPDKNINVLLVRACSILLDHRQDPGKAEFFLNKAKKKTITNRSLESVYNLFGYHFVSIGDFKNAETSFVKANELDDSADRRKYEHSIERVRELRKKFFYYEKHSVKNSL